MSFSSIFLCEKTELLYVKSYEYSLHTAVLVLIVQILPSWWPFLLPWHLLIKLYLAHLRCHWSCLWCLWTGSRGVVLERIVWFGNLQTMWSVDLFKPWRLRSGLKPGVRWCGWESIPTNLRPCFPTEGGELLPPGWGWILPWSYEFHHLVCNWR